MTYSIVGVGNCYKLWESALVALGKAVSAICDTDEKRLIGFDIPTFVDIHEFIKGDNSDYVVLATPVDTHYPLVKLLLNAGRNVIVEKPVSYDYSHVRELSQLAKQKGVSLIFAHHAAYAADVEWFLANRDKVERDLGDSVGFCSEFFDPYVENGSLLNDAYSLHGSYLDSAVNALSVLERVIRLDGITVLTDTAQLMSDDTISSEVHYRKEGLEGVIRTDWNRGINLKTTCLHYTKGSVLLNHSAQTVEIRTEKGVSVVDCNPHGRERLLNQYTRMIEAIEDGIAKQQSSEAIYGLLLNSPSDSE